ncbi:MAG TPA: hypothetical protein VN670_05810, partial [Acidobacteriaceae bacterium]|nr:hypothetical protein [Acidobacteriaceae bacterium]
MPVMDEGRMFKSGFEIADQLRCDFPLSLPVQMHRIKKEVVAHFELCIVVQKHDVAVGGGKAGEERKRVLKFFGLGLVQDVYRGDVNQIESDVAAGHEIGHPGELAQIVPIKINSAKTTLSDLPTQDLRIDMAEFKVRPPIQVTADNQREHEFVVPWSAEQPPKNVLGARRAVSANVFAYVRVIN